MVRKIFLGMAVLTIWGLAGVLNGTNNAQAMSKADLRNNVESMTNESVKDIYYADYDSDGSNEAFIITKKSKEQQSIWFTSEKETKKLAAASISVGKGRGICKVSSNQRLFVAEGSAGGSGSWSYCYYVKSGKVHMVKRAGEGLVHISGKDFKVFPSDFDANFDSGIWTGHTWKAYYLKWTGTGFVQYSGKKIFQKKVKSYSGGSKYLKQIKKAGYRIRKIYYRENGIININVSKRNRTGMGTDFDNVTLKVEGKKVNLVVIFAKGKDIVEKSG